jgi:hypothetical protein
MADERKNDRHYVEGTYNETMHMGWRRLSWGAIFCGLFAAITILLTLELLGAGIGISTLDIQNRGDNPEASTLGVGAAIWWLLSGLIALFAGGWIAGYLASVPVKCDRALHGLVVWSLMYIVMFWAVTTALSSVVGGTLGLIGKGLSTAGQAASSPQAQQGLSQTMQQYGINLDMIKQDIQQALGPNTPGQDKDNITKAAQDYLQGQRTPDERQKLVQSITQKTGKSPQEVDQMITKMEQASQKAEQVGEKAKEVGHKAVKITGGSLIGLAIVMILGAISAIIGAAIATGPYYIER